MDDNTQKIIKEKFDSLPKTIQEVILSSNYQETLFEIGKRYQLTVEQMGILEQETTLVMMGLTQTKNFETELISELKIDPVKGAAIVGEINEKVFLAIRELLKLMNTPLGEQPVIETEVETKKIESMPISKPAEIKTVEPKEEIRYNIEKPAEKIEDILAKLEKPNFANTPTKIPNLTEVQKEVVPAVILSKLSGSFQIPSKTTEYSLQNISKTGLPTTPTPAPLPSIPTSQLPTTPRTIKVDPYREAAE